MPGTVCGQQNTETRLQSDIADNIIWARFATPPSASSARQYLYTSRSKKPPRHILHFDFDFDDAQADRYYGPTEAVGGGEP